MTALTELPNLGATVCRRLAEVGIDSAEALAQLGPAGAYVSLVRAAGGRLPVCYYLYSLEGALRGEDWRCLSDRDKERLRAEAGLPSGRPRAPTTSGPRGRSRR